MEQKEKKRAKREAQDPVAEVLRAYGYVKLDESAVTVTAMKAFLRQNVQKVQMPRAAILAKRADCLDFLKALSKNFPHSNGCMQLLHRHPHRKDKHAAKQAALFQER